MWHPTRSQLPHGDVHESGVWRAEDELAKRQREYHQLQQVIAEQEGRIHQTTAMTNSYYEPDQNMEDEANIITHNNKVLLPSCYGLTSQSRAIQLNLATPSQRMALGERAKQTQAHTRKLAAKKREQAERNASRPSSSPFGDAIDIVPHHLAFGDGEHYRDGLPSSSRPATSPYGQFEVVGCSSPSSRPNSSAQMQPRQHYPAPPNSAPLGNTRIDHHDPFPSPPPASSSAAPKIPHPPPVPIPSQQPSNSPPSLQELAFTDRSATEAHPSFTVNASANEVANYAAKLSKNERRAVYQTRYLGKIWGIIGQQNTLINDQGAHFTLTTPRSGAAIQTQEEIEEQRDRDAEMYANVQEQLSATTAVQPIDLALAAAPSARPHPRPSTSDGQGVVRRVHRSRPGSSNSGMPSASTLSARQSRVAPATSQTHWSNRVYTKHLFHPAANSSPRPPPSAATSLTQRSASAASHRPATNSRPSSQPHRDQTQAVDDEPFQQAALPSQIRREKRYDEQEHKFLSEFGQELSAEFNALLNDARYQEHLSATHAEIGQQKLAVIQYELNKRAKSESQQDDLVQRLKHDHMKEILMEQFKTEKKHERIMKKHWKTGEWIDTDPSQLVRSSVKSAKKNSNTEEKESLSEEFKSNPALMELHAKHIQYYLNESTKLDQQTEQHHQHALLSQHANLSDGVGAQHISTEQTLSNLTEFDRPFTQAHHRPANTQHVGPALQQLDSNLRAIVSTEAFLQQSLNDTTQIPSQQVVQQELSDKQLARERRRQAKYDRHNKRRMVAKRPDAAGSGESSTDSEADDDDVAIHLQTEAAEMAAILPVLPPPPPAILAAAESEVQPILNIYALHSAAESAQRLLDETASVMRAQDVLRDAKASALCVVTSESAAIQARKEREREMAALVRRERNARAIEDTRRRMTREGECTLTLYAMSHLMQGIPPGYLARFEIVLEYSSSAANLPKVLAYSAPFRPSTTSPDGTTDILQTMSFPIINAHVQKLKISLQILTPKQLLHWMFQHKDELFNRKDSTTPGGGSSSALIAYLKCCESELMTPSIPALPTSSRPKSSQSGPRLLRTGSSAASSPRPKSSQSLVVHSSARAKSGFPSQSSDSNFMAEYQAGLADWFHQGSTTPATASSTTPTPSHPPLADSATMTHRERILMDHILVETDTEIFSGWLTAMRLKMKAYNDYVARVQRQEDVSAYAEDGSLRNAVLEPNDAAARRTRTIQAWTVEQVTYFLERLGLGETTVFKRRAILGSEFIASQERLERMALKTRQEKLDRLAREETLSPRSKSQLTSPSASRPTHRHQPTQTSFDQYAITSGNKQRSLDAMKLLRTFQLLRGEGLSPTPTFDFDQIKELRKLVFDAFHEVTTLPKYVAAARAAEVEAIALATTASLSAEESAQLSARLTALKNQVIEREAKHIQDAAFTPAANEAEARALALRTQLRRVTRTKLMDTLSTQEVEEWQNNRKTPTPQSGSRPDSSRRLTAGGVEIVDEEDGSDPKQPNQSLTVRPSSSPIGRPARSTPPTNPIEMFQSRPSSSTTDTQRMVMITGVSGHGAPSLTASSAVQRTQPVTEQAIRVLGSFELPIRQVAHAPDGIYHTFQRLQPTMTAKTSVPINPTIQPVSAKSVSHAHYRTDLSTSLSSSGRPYLSSTVGGSSRPSSVASTRITPSSSPSGVATVPSALVPSHTSPSWLRKHLRHEYALTQFEASQEWIHQARLELRAQFKPPNQPIE